MVLMIIFFKNIHSFFQQENAVIPKISMKKPPLVAAYRKVVNQCEKQLTAFALLVSYCKKFLKAFQLLQFASWIIYTLSFNKQRWCKKNTFIHVYPKLDEFKDRFASSFSGQNEIAWITRLTLQPASACWL